MYDEMILSVLTLRELSLFLKMIPISNTGVLAAYILAIVHFLYPKLPFPTWSITSTTCLLRLESPQGPSTS